MTQDIADNLDGRTALDLTGRVRVTKDVCAKEVGMNACSARITMQSMPNRGRTSQSSMRELTGDEHCSVLGMGGALVPQVPRYRSCDRVEKRKQRHDTGFRATDANRPRRPVDVVERQRTHLACAHAVSGHHQKEREVAAAQWTTYVDRT